MVLAELINRNARRYPNKTALVFGNTRCTFDELNKRVNSLVNALSAKGIKKGDRIACLMDDSDVASLYIR